MAEQNSLTLPNGALPAVRSDRRLQAAIDILLPAYDDLRDGEMDGRAQQVRDGLNRLTALRWQELIGPIESGRRAATVDDIRLAVAELFAVTKHLDKVDGPVFQAALIQDIGDEEPTRLGLALALRKVRQTCRYMPSLAEVIDALRASESALRSAVTRLERLPDLIGRAEAFLIRST